jgi:hypothetical protein
MDKAKWVPAFAGMTREEAGMTQKGGNDVRAKMTREGGGEGECGNDEGEGAQ